MLRRLLTSHGGSMDCQGCAYKAALGAKENGRPGAEVWWTGSLTGRVWNKQQAVSGRKKWFSSSRWEQASLPVRSRSPEEEKGSCLGRWPPLKDSVQIGINKQGEQRGTWTATRAPLTQEDKGTQGVKGLKLTESKIPGLKDRNLCFRKAP